MITEILASLGSWSITLAEETPDAITSQIGYFGHVAVIDGRVDVERVGDNLLSSARYVGVIRAIGKPVGVRTLGGSGMVYWLGDEDGKGDVIESPGVVLTNATLAQCVTALLPAAVTAGVINSQPVPAARYTGTFVFTTRREALQTVCDAFGVEFRVNGNATVDVGTQAQLYTILPTTAKRAPLIRRAGVGSDLDTIAMPGDLGVDGLAYDYSNRIVLLGQTQPADGSTGVPIATGSADAPSSPYRDMRGGVVKSTRLISESGTTAGTVAQRAQLQMNRYNRTPTTLSVTAPEFEFEGNFRAGDDAYVYDPDSGIVDNTREVSFRGEILHPAIIRVTGTSWRVRTGSQTVGLRTQAGVWVDLTPFVTDETGTDSITVGDQPASLIPANSTISGRVSDAQATGRTPGTPTGLALSTSSGLDPAGNTVSVVTAGWVAPTTNTDSSVPVSLSTYAVQWRWQARAPQWQTTYTSSLSIDLPVAPNLDYDVRVAAVSQAGIVGPFSAVSSIHSSQDAVAPPAPADPVVTSYLGQLRIEYPGTASGGGPMPSDTNRVDVHVGTTSSFVYSPATRVSSITPFAKGVAYATAPYGSPRWALLVAYDNAGNVSASSARITGTTVQAGDGDIAALSVGKLTAGTMTADVVTAGRFATALTGARRELNPVGFQAWDSSSNLTISLDGVSNLLTGIFKTALTGRRIEIGSGGSYGQISFMAPDGTQISIDAFTSGGSEAIALSAPAGAGNNSAWNSLQIQANGLTFIDADNVNIAFNGTAAGNGNFRVDQALDKGNLATFPTLRGRIFIDKTNTQLFAPYGGATQLAQYDSGGTSHIRLQISGSQLLYWDQAGVNRFIIDQSSQYITFNFSGNEYAEMKPSDNISRSAHLLMVHPTAGYGASLSYVAASADGVTTPRLEVRDAANSTYIPVYASAFTVSSSAAGKNSISPFEVSAMEKLRPLKLKTFRRKGHANREGIHAEDQPEEFGVIAEEVPEEMVTRDENGEIFGVDLPRSLWLILAGLQETEARLAAVEKKGKP